MSDPTTHPVPTLPDTLVTAAFVRARWGVGRQTISNWESRGILKPKRIGRVRRYLLSDVIAAERAVGINHEEKQNEAR
jgi:hypothetical protein